jgi:hypothetical protein
MGDERRQHPRIPARVAAEVRFTSWEMFGLIYTINISHGGMSLEVPQKENVGASVKVRLTPPKGNSVELSAVVRHCTEHKGRFTVGVEFTDLDAEKKAAIERSIRAHGGSLNTSLKPIK